MSGFMEHIHRMSDAQDNLTDITSIVTPSEAVPFVLGSGAFAASDKSVISWEGDNYYRACDAEVMVLPDGGRSHCVLRVGHPSKEHEDFHGNRIRPHVPVNFEFDEMTVKEAIGQAIGAASVCWEHPENAGVFKSQTAAELAEQLLNRVISAGADFYG